MRHQRFLLGLASLIAMPIAVTAEDGPKLATQAKAVLEKHCYRCHGQNSAKEGGVDYILDFAQLREKKLKPGDPKSSRLYKRLISDDPMPPDGEEPRPDATEIALVEQWIKAGAPDYPAEAEEPARKFVDLQMELQAMRDYLKNSRKVKREDRPYIRFFTLRHLHNMPTNKVKAIDLRIYQAALSKLINSLSWKNLVVLPEAINPEQTTFAVDIRKLDWDRKNLWLDVLRHYPYGLTHSSYPDEETTRELAMEIADMTGADAPVVRADWFIAIGSKPPLYNLLMQLPMHAGELERMLKVDVADNFRRGELARAGLNASGVSSGNRLVERHEASTGGYWKSYDFKVSAGRGNLFVYPLGPEFPGNPYNRQAFHHDGGEIIFNLPNGLQGYMLVDEKDRRIDAGPIEIVRDRQLTTGTPQIVTGLSCMFCHKEGMIEFKDQIRDSNILGGAPRDRVRQLFPEPDDMDKLVKRDRDRFVRALEDVMRPFLNIGEDAQRKITDFPEPVGHIAKWYLNQEMTLEEAASELGLSDAAQLHGAIVANPRLQEAGLFPLTRRGTIKREVWEFRGFTNSPFQEAAREMKLGSPLVNINSPPPN